MEEKGHRSEDDLERRCEAVSPAVEPCDYPATVHCAKCCRWFCDAHAEDEEWQTNRQVRVVFIADLLGSVESLSRKETCVAGFLATEPTQKGYSSGRSR